MSLVRYSPGGNVCNLGVQYKNPGPQGATGPAGAFAGMGNTGATGPTGAGTTGATGPTGVMNLGGATDQAVLVASGANITYKSTFTFNKTTGYGSNGTLTVNQVNPLYVTLTPTATNPNASGANSTSSLWYDSTEGIKIGKASVETLGDPFTIALGTGTSKMQYSRDGASWFSTQGTTFDTAGRGIVWNGNIWVAVGLGSYTMLYSSSGISWDVPLGTQFGYAGYGVGYGNGRFVAVGTDNSTGGGNTIITSIDDGRNWEANASGVLFSKYGYDIAFNGYRWVAVGDNTGEYSTGTNIIYSDDGIKWNSVTYDGVGSSTMIGNSVTWNGKRWVAVGSNSGGVSIVYSDDGITWYSSYSYFDGFGYKVSSNIELFVAVGNHSNSASKILYSTNGITWYPSTGSTFTGVGSAITWNGERWIAMSTSGEILTSLNGKAWSNVFGQGTNLSMTAVYDLGSRYLKNEGFPFTQTCATIWSRDDQTIVADAVPTLISVRETILRDDIILQGISLQADVEGDPYTKIIIPADGVYKFSISVQISGDGGDGVVYFWLQRTRHLDSTVFAVDGTTRACKFFDDQLMNLSYENILKLGSQDIIRVYARSTTTNCLIVPPPEGAEEYFFKGPGIIVNVYRLS